MKQFINYYKDIPNEFLPLDVMVGLVVSIAALAASNLNDLTVVYIPIIGHPR
jgi:flagellar biosynthesis protein FliQ